MKKLLLTSLLLGLALGCAADSGKGPILELERGKADGDLEVVDNGPLTPGDAVDAELAPGIGHSWTVEITGDAALVVFETTAEQSVDTVIHVTGPDGEELGADDDGGVGLFSRYESMLDPGVHVVTVTGYANAETGPFTMTSACEACDGAGENPGTDPGDDPWAGARDVHAMHVQFTDATPIPESFTSADAGPVRLSGPEWWQRWSGGATQSFSWDRGTDYGKRCGQASAIRLQAIWEYAEEDGEGNVTHPGREAFEALLDGSGWSGTMYNWTEDVSEGGWPVFDPATMWAWRTGAVKWINVVRPDGSCDLPTLDLVQRFSATCLEQASHEDGAIEGCQASGR